MSSELRIAVAALSFSLFSLAVSVHVFFLRKPFVQTVHTDAAQPYGDGAAPNFAVAAHTYCAGDDCPSFAHSCIGAGCAPQPWEGETCDTPGHLGLCVPTGASAEARVSDFRVPLVPCYLGQDPPNCVSDVITWTID